MQRVYDILKSILGESKQGRYDRGLTQYQFNCPYCADMKGGVDNKYNLEVSFSLGKFHCWSCGNSGPLSRLIRSRGGQSLVREYFDIINEIREAKYYDISMFDDKEELAGENYLTLPKTFSKIIIKYNRNRSLLNFLKKRNITQDIIDYYNIGYTEWDGEEHGWRNRLIIPSYNEFGELNYFIGRTYKDSDKRVKYKNCQADKNTIVLHEDKIQWDADIYLVEGALDCIYYPNSIALMGKFLNRKMVLFSKLYERANAKIVICLDGDTGLSETKRLYRLLDRGRLRNRIRYIRMGTDEVPYKDFGEIYENEGREGIIKAMKMERSFNEFELLI